MGIAKDPKELTLGKIYPRRPVLGFGESRIREEIL